MTFSTSNLIRTCTTSIEFPDPGGGNGPSLASVEDVLRVQYTLTLLVPGKNTSCLTTVQNICIVKVDVPDQVILAGPCYSIEYMPLGVFNF